MTTNPTTRGENDPFTIDVWSDVVCPFCYLGERQLHQALARFAHADAVVIQFHAFELDPNARLRYDRPLADLVAHKYDMPVERAHNLHERLESEAAALGMTWSLATAQPTNTFDAHRLIALAAEQGVGAAMVDRLFAAYFTQGELVSDHATLERLGDEVGVRGVSEMLASSAFSNDVRVDEADAMELGISGVPAMLLDGRFLVSGARPVEELVDVLTRAWDRRAVA